MKYSYWVIEAKNEDDLTKRLNDAAERGWEAVNAYSVSGGNVNAAHHYALLRRAVP